MQEPKDHKDPEDSLAPPGRLVAQAHAERQENEAVWVSQAPRVRGENPDLRVDLAHRDNQDLPDPEESLDLLEPQAAAVNRVYQDRQGPLVPVETADSQDPRVHLDPEARLEHLDLMDNQDRPDPPDLLDNLDHAALLVKLVSLQLQSK